MSGPLYFTGLGGWVAAGLALLNGQGLIAFAAASLGSFALWAAWGFGYPGSVWSYYGRFLAKYRDWRTQVEWQFNRLRAGRGKLRDLLTAIRPPTEFQQRHAQLLQQLDDYRAALDGPLEDSDRWDSLWAKNSEVWLSLDALIGDSERKAPAYSARLAAACATRLNDNLRSYRAAERETERLISYLDNARTPSAIKADRDSVQAALRRCLQILRSTQDSLIAHDFDRIREEDARTQAVNRDLLEAIQEMRRTAFGRHPIAEPASMSSVPE